MDFLLVVVLAFIIGAIVGAGGTWVVLSINDIDTANDFERRPF